ncbi:cell division protein FtsL [Neobacillus bataviensis LMG 21833]|uniref:Cell division protein FtsL n=1 Tax=Neobacillus bataviensis LMG 21833 TaxID=1117379 RepID=K6DE42_9BACI|nr:cell division protein FtsL [Neobacillus bataviensis]EKN66333.1 cell division protein FtsL [Neobacillus bataviensis LMG 21833]
MSNLARKYLEQQQAEQKVQNKSQVKIKKSWLTPGEKVIGVVFAGMVCFGSVHLITNQSKIYEVNKDIQLVEEKISDQKKVNSDLQVQVKELSSYDRIFKKAVEMGLFRDENNVKVVQKK